MDVAAALKCRHERRIVREMREQPQLDLGVVGDEEQVTGRRHEGAPDLAAAARAHGDVLEIGIGGGETPGGRAGLIEARVDAAGVRPDVSGEGVHVGGLQLRQLAVLDQQAWHFVAEGRQLLEHLDVRRGTRLGSLLHGQLQALEQDGPELRRRVDVELAAGGAVNVELERGQLFIEAARHFAQQHAIHENPRRLHVHEHRNERNLDLVEESLEMVCLDIGPKCLFEPQHHLRLCGRDARRLGGRDLGERSLRSPALPFSQQLRGYGQLDGEMLARQIVDRVRAVPRIEDEARDHRVVGDARERDTGARKRDPRRLDVVPRFVNGRVGQERAQRRERFTRERWQVAWRRCLEFPFARHVAEGEIPRAPGGHRE